MFKYQLIFEILHISTNEKILCKILIGPTSQKNTGDWSYTGGYGQAQPDNREAAQGRNETCFLFCSFAKVIANFHFQR